MTRCERFVYALFNGVGYKLLKTDGIDKILTHQNLERLSRLPSRCEYYTHWLDTEKLIAISQVDQVIDEYGRKGIRNHTILMTVPDYLMYLNPRQQFEAIFNKKECFSSNQLLELVEI